MIKYGRALQLGTAEAEHILRLFSGRGPQHPTLAAIEEPGRAYQCGSALTPIFAPGC